MALAKTIPIIPGKEKTSANNLRKIEWKRVWQPYYKKHQAEACEGRIYMLVSIAQFVGCFKGKSTLMIFDQYANLKHIDPFTGSKNGRA